MSCDGVDIGDAPPGPVASPLLIDLTVIQMAYASWSNGTADSHAVFELFFRRSAHPPARAPLPAAAARPSHYTTH